MALRNGAHSWQDASLSERLPDDFLLRRPIRSSQSCASSILIYGRAKENSKATYGLHAVLAGLELHPAHALPARVAVGRLVEGEAPPLLREHLRAAEAHVALGPEQQVAAQHQAVHEPGGHRRPPLPPLPPAHGHLRHAASHQRGGAGGLRGARRAREPQDAGQPRAGREARGLVAPLLPRGVQVVPVRSRVADKDAALPAPHLPPGMPGLPEGLVANLQEAAVVGVHPGGLLLGYAEEPIVKHGDLCFLHQATVAGHGEAWPPVLLIVHVDVPSKQRDDDLRIGARGKHVPEGLSRRTAPGIPGLNRHDICSHAGRLLRPINLAQLLLLILLTGRRVQHPRS
mmetsp:Transcript_27020/g.77549  ORF Transcript_27020/g.77549 Transcript_27020/m.77549 type:complete len:343 (+) Transcript_27020:575-1603(+)